MIDLHSHILPQVDDGARSLGEAVEMCRRAASEGCTALVATPHQRHPRWANEDRGGLEETCARLRRELEGVVDLHLGGEIRVDSQLLAATRSLPEGEILPLARSRYLLLELDPGGAGPAPEELVHELLLQGWRPVLTHPEHIPWLCRDMARLARLVDLGALLQVTGMSLLGDLGGVAQRACCDLLDAELVHFVASDSHRIDWRPPGLRNAYRMVARRWGEDVAMELFVVNPGAVLADRALEPGAPRET